LTRQRISPQEVQKILAHASEVACEDCGAPPGQPCTRPGAGRTVCKLRYIQAAISLRRQAKAKWQTPEQQAEQAEILAALPKVARSEIEKCRTAKGGYAFTRTWFLDHGLPYPPIAGWRRAVEREEE
jgi:hypothetical protein